MPKTTTIFFPILAFVLFVCFTGCSSSNSPVDTDMSADNPNPDSALFSGNREIIGNYIAQIDPANQTFTIKPVERSGAFHFNLTSLFPNVLTIEHYDFGPPFIADIKISHPLPASNIDVFDPRVIAIIPANSGVSMYYPEHNILANNSAVLNADGYTKIWYGPAFPGNANPFIAYMKSRPNRLWSSISNTEETVRWKIDLAGFGGPLVFELVVDISTNYPSPPYPYIDNVPEPFQIDAEISSGLDDQGGSAEIEVTLMDWQGETTIGGVTIEAPDLFNGTVSLDYSGPGPEPFEYIYNGVIANDLLAYSSEYGVLISAWDDASGIHVYNEFTAYVEFNGAFNLQDVTPYWLKAEFHWDYVYVDNNLAYLSGGNTLTTGIDVYDVSDPAHPQFVIQIPTDNCPYETCVADGYLYFTDGSDLKVVDVNPITNPQVVQIVNLSGTRALIKLKGDYAYVASNYFYILDISSPEDTFLISSVDVEPGDFGVRDFDINDDYAFVTCSKREPYVDYGKIQIIDINPPQTASLYLTHDANSNPLGEIVVSNGYAFAIPDIHVGMLIVYDIDPVESMFEIENSIDIWHYITELDVDGDLAYIAGMEVYSDKGVMHIISIADPNQPYKIKTVNSSGQIDDIHVSDGYAYVTDDVAGLQIFDVDPPLSTHLLNPVQAIPDAQNVFFSDDYLFVSSHDYIYILDMDPIGTSQIVASFPTYLSRAAVQDGEYLYVTDANGLQIFDIDPIQSAELVGSVDCGWCTSLDVQNGYAVVTDYSRIKILDIDPPQDAYQIKEISDLNHSWRDVKIKDGYAYVADNDEQLCVFDIDPPEDFQMLYSTGSVALTSLDIIDNNHLCGVGWNSIHIFDISDPLNAEEIHSAWSHNLLDVEVQGNYAFTSSGIPHDGKLTVFDINDPLGIQNLVDITIEDKAAWHVSVQGNLACISHRDEGISIIQLW